MDNPVDIAAKDLVEVFGDKVAHHTYKVDGIEYSLFLLNTVFQVKFNIWRESSGIFICRSFVEDLLEGTIITDERIDCETDNHNLSAYLLKLTLSVVI